MQLRRHSITALVTALSLILASCSNGADDDTAELDLSAIGAECDGVGDIEAPPSYFANISVVESYSTAAIRDAVARDVRTGLWEGPNLASLRDTPGEVLVKNDTATDRLSTLLAGPSDRADLSRLPRGLTALVASRRKERPEPAALIVMVGVETGDGDLVFAGRCSDRRFRQPLEAFRDDVYPEQTLAAVFLDVVGNREAWQRFSDHYSKVGAFAAPTFEDLDPRDRQLDVETTPVEVLEGLERYAIEVELPRGWAAIPNGAVCTFVEQGWNECFAFEAVDRSSTAELLGYGEPGATFAFWLIDYANDGIDAPLAFLGEVTAPVPTAQEGAFTVRIEGDSSATSLGALTEQALAGTYTVRRIDP